MKDLERIFKALANRRRLAIIKYLKNNRDASVGEISKAIKASFKASSKHLIILSAASVVEREQVHFQAAYNLAPKIGPILKVLLSLI